MSEQCQSERRCGSESNVRVREGVGLRAVSE